MKKIIIFSLSVIALLLLFALPSFAEDNTIIFGKNTTGSQIVMDMDLLYKPSDSSDYSWVSASGGFSSPSLSQEYYEYNFISPGTGTLKGIRLYFTVLGTVTQRLVLSFEGVPYDCISVDSYGKPLDDPGISGSFYKLSQSGFEALAISNFGVSSFNEENNTVTLSFSVPCSFDDYARDATTYDYNAYVEFYFNETDAETGWTYTFGNNDTPVYWPVRFYFHYYSDIDASIVIVDIYNFSENTFAAFINSILTSGGTLIPVVPVIDFVNGTSINGFLGNNLGRIINPFVPLFVSSDVNNTWVSLCMFSFGMFVLMTLLKYFRREAHK